MEKDLMSDGSKQAIGMFVILLAICGILLAVYVYPRWVDNSKTIAWNEAHGHYSFEDRYTLYVQSLALFGGLGFGILFLIVGTYLFWAGSDQDKSPTLVYHLPPPQQTEDDDLIVVDEESADVCPRCRQLIDKSWKRCPSCLLPLKINCPECNEEMDASWNACPHCGKILKKKTIIKKEALRG